MTAVQKLGVKDKRYVRLSPTTLLVAPECYGSKPDLAAEKCWLCPVKRPCEDGREVEARAETR